MEVSENLSADLITICIWSEQMVHPLWIGATFVSSTDDAEPLYESLPRDSSLRRTRISVIDNVYNAVTIECYPWATEGKEDLSFGGIESSLTNED